VRAGRAEAGFDELSPALALEAVEEFAGLRLDGTMSTYPSYVNRVYGFRTEDGEALVAKFYRPGRWSYEAILEEHDYMADCVAADIPVVTPLPGSDGSTLATLELEGDEGSVEYNFALFPKKGGRNFDAETDADWRRLGAIAGRLHRVGAAGQARRRQRFDAALVRGWVEELRSLVHPETRADFEEGVASALEAILPRLETMELQRIHGDLHRGNILERPGEGLLVIDFDDCMNGPPVQDLWLLLPDRAPNCPRELSLLMEGYGDFAVLPRGSMAFIEGLRFLRMLHFLAWRARQRHDAWFAREFPDWGSKGYWSAEIESLREQSTMLGLDEDPPY